MARFTIYLENGKEIDFESATLKINNNVPKGTIDASSTIKSLEYNMKDNGMSLLFVKLDTIVAITRDTRKED